MLLIIYKSKHLQLFFNLWFSFISFGIVIKINFFKYRNLKIKKKILIFTLKTQKIFKNLIILGTLLPNTIQIIFFKHPIKI